MQMCEVDGVKVFVDEPMRIDYAEADRCGSFPPVTNHESLL
jgi:hypothetical protein